MNQTNVEFARPRLPAKTTMLLGLALLAATTFGTVFIGRTEPVALETAAIIAGIIALAVFAMAALMSRGAVYPRWGWFAAAGIMAVSIAASLLATDDPSFWVKDVRQSAWMLPWFLFAVGMVPAKGARACAEPRSGMGWVLVGLGALLSVILLGAPYLGRLI